MQVLHEKPESLKDSETHYCAGCRHRVVHRLVAEVIDELGVRERTVGVAPVGCAVLAYDYFNMDITEAPHGRTPAVATGIKRVLPDRVVFTYQGDGDLAAIGTAEIVHAANRGECITVVFVNNAVYGMTGGQMAPTSLLGQKTSTTPHGRDPLLAGYPLRVAELLSGLDGVRYIARVSTGSPRDILEAKRSIRKAFEVQLAGDGFALVEVLATCPSYWRMGPLESLRWLREEMTKTFPLGVFKDSSPGNGQQEE